MSIKPHQPMLNDFIALAPPSYNRKIFLRISLFVLLSLWCIGFSVSLYAVDLFTVSSPFLKLFYSHICHQNPDKTPAIFGAEFFVCSRCAGIYVGAFLASSFSLFASFVVQKKLVIISLLIILADVVFHNIGVYEYSKIIAFTSGLFSGSILFVYILNIIEENFADIKIKNVF